MQAVYWVLSWACHRRCRHCYDDRFRPYTRGALDAVVDEGVAAHQKIIANLPDDLTWYNDRSGAREKTLLVLAGGELLIDPVRERLFYPVLASLKDRYGAAMPKLAMQTTGDVLTPQLLDEILERCIQSIAIASIDDYHVGMEGERKFVFMDKIRQLMESRGVREVSLGGEKTDRLKAPDLDRAPKSDEPTFLFFGAQTDLWIGELWPRGRALSNGLTNADYETNFCARWSGGKNFLKLGQAGSEVAIEPDGSVYPCCLKTKAPLGSLAEEPLEDILESVADIPAIRAINAGDPEIMGAEAGWSRETFRARSKTMMGNGASVENMCIGCDAYFEAHLSDELARRRANRLRARAS
ncbi:MAG: SPASM domain-containing protein [Pseudomonadota bacterium]